MNPQQTIQTQRQTLTSWLGQIHAEHAALAAKLVDQPDDFDLLDAVHAARQKIDSTQARIALFDEAAATHATKSAQAQRIATAVASRDEAVELAARRITVAKGIDKAMATFCELMGEYSALNDQIISASTKVLKHAQDKPRLQTVQDFAAVARSNLSDPLVSVLHRAGIDRLAPGSVNLVGRAGPESFKDVAAKASERLAGLLDSALQGDA